MSSSAIRAGAAFVELGIRNKMEAGLNAAHKRLKGFAAGVSGAGMSMAGLGLKIVTPFTIAAGVFGSFSAKMAAVKAITNSSDAQMQQLRDTAKTLGASTQFSASEAAEAMKFLGMAGYNTEQILAGIPAVLDLAAAGAIDLGMAADIASDVSSAFGLAADDIGLVADVMATTATSSNTSIEMMGETFKYLAPLAAAAGQSIEEAAAAVGTIANSGVKASMAGTDLALMMKTLADPAAQKRLKSLGVETIDAAGNVRDFSDIMRDLGAATANMQEAKKLAFFEGVFGRAAKSALILTNNTQGLDDLNTKLANSEGAAKRMAATMQDSPMGDFISLLSAAEGVAIEVGEALEIPLRKGLQYVTGLVRRTSEWIKENKAVVLTVAGIAAGLIAAGSALVAIATPILAVGLLMKGLAIAVAAIGAALVLPFTFLISLFSVAGIHLALLVAEFYMLERLTGVWGSILGDVASQFRTLFKEVGRTGAAINDAINAGDFGAAWEVMKTSGELAWKTMLNGFKSTWVGFRVWFLGIWDSALAGITATTLETFANILESLSTMMPFGASEFDKHYVDTMRNMASDRRNQAEADNVARYASGAEEIAKLDAEIAALKAARESAITNAANAAADAAAESSTNATDAAMKAAQAAAANAGQQLRGSALGEGSFSAFAAERSFRTSGGVTDAFQQVGNDIVDAVNGVTDAVNNIDGLAFGT